MNKPLAYIIDLDGTLYDNSQRQHLIPADRSNTSGWVAFNSACAEDGLREDMADLVRSVLLSGREVIFLTGRGESAREPTMQRLLKDFNFIEQPTLIMRPMDWHTSAAEFKRSAVEKIWFSERWAQYRLIALEDDPSVVEVMRGMGVTVLQIDSKCCALQDSNELTELQQRRAAPPAPVAVPACFVRLHEVIKNRHHGRMPEEVQIAFDECDAMLQGAEPVTRQSDGVSSEQHEPPERGWVVTHGGKDYFYREQPDAVTHLNAALESGGGASLNYLSTEPVSQPYKLPIIGWVRTDYHDENRKGDAPLFIVGEKDPSVAWGVPYLRVGNSPAIPDGWVKCSERMPDPDSKFRVCAYTPSPHEDLRYRFVPASLFKSVCRDATHWQYMLPPAAPQQEAE